MDDDQDFASLVAVMNSVQGLHRQAAREYAPIVEELIRNRCRDAHTIERTLEGLLDFCGHEPVVALYRRLCRHYYDIDPAATAEYVCLYRQLWDLSDDDPK